MDLKLTKIRVEVNKKRKFNTKKNKRSGKGKTFQIQLHRIQFNVDICRLCSRFIFFTLFFALMQFIKKNKTI